MRAALVAGLLTALIHPLAAQTQYGLRTGITTSTLAGDFDLAEAYDTRTGFAVGLTAQWPSEGPLAAQVEILYSQYRSRIDGGQAALLGRPGIASASIERTYFEIPVLAVLRAPPLGGLTLSLHAGPSVGIEFDEVARREDDGSVEDPNVLGSPNVSLTGGVDVAVPVGRQRVLVGARYLHGLRDLSGGEARDAAGNPATVQNRALVFSVGVQFGG